MKPTLVLDANCPAPVGIPRIGLWPVLWLHLAATCCHALIAARPEGIVGTAFTTIWSKGAQPVRRHQVRNQDAGCSNPLAPTISIQSF